MHSEFLSESLKGRNDIGGGRIILKWILKKQGMGLWTGFFWLWTGTSGGIL
jgi:hypothetical protein